jgi:tetratricopeptide (TPR) repeat protein
VFTVQSDVAQRVAAALTATLTPGEKERIERIPTGNFEAYRLYLKGRHFWEQRGKGIMKGLEYFRRALEVDPDFALAHGGVADCYSLLGFYGYFPPTEAMPKARAAALRALEIDEGLAEAHSSLGFIRQLYDWDLAAAEGDYRRAIELNPGYPPAHYWLASDLVLLGRVDEAIHHDRRAIELDPLSVFTNTHLGWMLIGARDYEWARKQLGRALEMDPNFPPAHWLQGLAHAHDGMLNEASAFFEEGVGVSGSDPLLVACLGWAHGLSGREGKARDLLSKLKEWREERYVRAFTLALVPLGLGDLGEAMEWLEKAYEERDMEMALLRVDPILDPLRADPRFSALMERVGLVPFPGGER